MRFKGKYAWLKHLDFMIIDLVSLIIAFVVSYCLKFHNFGFVYSEAWMRFILIIILLDIIIEFYMNPYSGIFRRSYYQEIIKALQLAFYNLVLASVIFYLFKIGGSYSRVMTLFMYAFYFFLSLILKYVWKKLLVSGRIVIYSTKRIPLFILGTKDGIQRTIRNVTAGDFQLYDIKAVHLIDDKHEKIIDTTIEDEVSIPVINEEYISYILRNNIREVLFAVNPGLIDQSIFETLMKNGVGISMVIEDTIGFHPEDQCIQNFGIHKALSVGTFRFTPGQLVYLGIKRVFDITCGLIGLVVLLPIALIVKVSYLLSGDKAAIIYSQARIGLHGKLIRIYKFRTMVPNADEILKDLLKQEKYRIQWEENQKINNDPRITKIGRFLRKTSIDELPQLINVLRGDMSLVGPRPLVVNELENHGGLKLYQKVKPGITGWWGCNGRNNIDYNERLELEYYYVKHCSLYLDLLCVFRTMIAVLKRDGAQ